MALDLALPNELRAPFPSSSARYASPIVNKLPIVSDKASNEPLFIKKRQSRARSNSVLLASNKLFSTHFNRRVVSLGLGAFPLSHKVSFYDLYKDEEKGMDSDSSLSSASVFSDPEEGNDSDDDNVFTKLHTNKKASSLQFPTSCSSAINSYFIMPTDNLPTKKTLQQPLNLLSSNPLFLNEPPQLLPDLSAARTSEYPLRSTGFSWGMPSFGSSSTKYFPRHCKARRTHSMFEHPEKVLLSLRDNISSSSVQPLPLAPYTSNPSILSQENSPIKTHSVSQDQFKRIDSTTLCEIMDGRHASLYDRYIIVDSRFEYEYEGGHIDGAININSKQCLNEKLFSNVSIGERVLLIFHCEYSAHRGPRMAMQLRNLDRQANVDQYPMLYYPDIVILSGGYSSFFKNHANRCFPQKYVGMNDNSHTETCEREMDRFRRNMKTSKTQYSVNDANLSHKSFSGFTDFPGSSAKKSLNFSLEKPTFLKRKVDSNFSSPFCIKTDTLFDDSTPTAKKRRLGGYSKLSAPAARDCF